MYNISLSVDQEFSTNPTGARTQSPWFFAPGSPLDIVSFIGAPNPIQVTVDTRIQNYLITYPGVYSHIYVAQTLINPIINGVSVPFMSVSGPIHAATMNDPLGYEINAGNLHVNTYFDFQLMNIPRGRYFSTVRFTVKGIKATDGTVVEIDVVDYYVNLIRLNYGEVEVRPIGFVEMAYHWGGSLPNPVKRTLYATGAFTAEMPKHIALSGANLVLQSNNDGIKTYSGSGTQDIFFSLESSIDTEPQAPGIYAAESYFRGTGMTLGVGIKVYLYGNENLTVSPESLQFQAVKGIVEADYQMFLIEGSGNYTITVPNWMELLGPASGSGTQRNQVRPVHSDNLNVGTYSGKIKISASSGDLFITVSHKVYSHINTGYRPNGLNFTKDRDTISTIYGHNSQKILIELAMSVNGFLLQDDFIRPARITQGVFNNKAQFYLGSFIDKVMPELEHPSQIGLTALTLPLLTYSLPFRVFKYYNPSKTMVMLSYLDRETGAYEGGFTHAEVRFLRGRRPARLLPVAAIVDYFLSPIRVTKNSFALLPIFRNEGSSKISVFRNGVLYSTLYPDRGNVQVFSLQLGFSRFTPGDVIDVVVDVQEMESHIDLRQRYIMFPEGKNSYHIAWENEHGMLQLLEFTGDYQFKSDHKAVSTLNFENFLEHTQKMHSQRKLNLAANTGWILKENQERIDSLVDANRAWVIFTDNRSPIAMVPDDSKLTNIDSDAHTYQYTVDFTINPDHELENHSF